MTPGSPVEDEVFYELSTRQAVAMVAGLSKDQAEVVALRVIAGLDTEAVARMLRKSARRGPCRPAPRPARALG